MKNRFFTTGIIYIVLGIALFVASITMNLGTTTIARVMPGLGGGFLGVGIINLYRGIRLGKDAEYRENFEVETHDERNKYLRMKAWSWAGYLFIIGCSAFVIIFALIDRPDLMQMAAYGTCIMLVLYWVCYLIVRKKY